MKYPEATVQSQYAASPVIRKLVDAMNARIDPEADIGLFYREVFDIMTARGWGLDVWGRILAVGRLLEVEPEDAFGFAGSGLMTFGQGAFFYPSLTNAHSLADEPYRELLLFKALANISPADAATMNDLLGRLFPGEAAYVIETGVMAIRFVFECRLKPWQRALFRSYGVLTRGAGVWYEWLEVVPRETFGFAGSGMQPFDQGVFFLGGPVAPREAAALA